MTEKSATTPVRKSGDRKRKGASEAPRKVMAFRVSDGLYKKLEEASQGRGFSLSEEIEARLEQSFRDGAEPYIDTALRMAAANCTVVQELTGATIANDPFTRVACAKAAASAIELVGGLAAPETKDAPETVALLQTGAEGFGQLVAMFTQALKDGHKNDFTDGIGSIIQILVDRRQKDVEHQRQLLAQALRDGAKPVSKDTVQSK